MATYYVATTGNDANAGTEAAPFRTIAKGYSLLNGGDTCYVRGGTYNVKLSMNRSGSSGNPITLAAYPGELPIIDGSGGVIGANFSETLVDMGGSYNVLDGFEVRNCTPVVQPTSARNLYLIEAFQSNYNTIRNCNIHTGWGCGVHLHGNGHVIEDCEVWDAVTYSLAYPNNGDWPAGITIGTYGADTYGFASNCTVRRCKSYSNGGEGIMPWNSHYTTVEDCEIYDNRAVQLHLTDSDNCTIQRNKIYCTQAGIDKFGGIGRGICLSNETNKNTAGSTYNKVINNIVYACGEAFSCWRYGSPQAIQTCNNNLVAYNAFVDTRLTGVRGSGAYMINFWGSGTVTANTFQNNVIDSTIAGVVSFNGSPTGWTFTNNIWRLSPTGITLDGASTVANPYLTRTGSVAAGTFDHEFFRPLIDSWCYEHGTPVSGITSDYLSMARDATTPTVGALEGTGPAWINETPLGWARSDIGGATGGSAGYNEAGQYRLIGNGADMWAAADGFSFLHIQAAGDFTLSYEIASFDGIDYAKVGSDVRSGLGTDASHVAITRTGNGYIQRLLRATNAGSTSATTVSGSSDMWQKIQRTGDAIVTSRSADGSTWTQVASDSIVGWPSTLYVGLLVCGYGTTLRTAIFDNVSLVFSQSSVGTMTALATLAGVCENVKVTECVGTMDAGATLSGTVVNDIANTPPPPVVVPPEQPAPEDDNWGGDCPLIGTGAVDFVSLEEGDARYVLQSAGLVVVDVPAAADSDGSVGQCAYDADYFYLCVATDTWVRSALATWP